MAELAARNAKAPAAGHRRARKQRLPRAIASIASTAVPATMRHLLPPGGGEPLPAGVAERMGERFGIDLRGVRVHSGMAAQRAAAEQGAAAYTIGAHIVFAEGRFDPYSPAGERLLAHELAHVVQQARGGAQPDEHTPDAAIERGAEVAAERVAAGDPAVAVVGASGVGVARAPLPAGDEASARQRIVKAIGELQRLELAAANRKEGEAGLSLAESARALDAITLARREARNSGSATLTSVADGLIDQFDAVTRDTPAARPGSSFDPHPAAETDRMSVEQAHRAVSAQRGFEAGLGVGRLKDAPVQLDLLESAAKSAATEKERTALRKKAEALRRRIAISRPTLHNADQLAQQKVALETQLAKAKPTQQAHLRRKIDALQSQIDAVRAAEKNPSKTTLPALHGGPLGHSGSTNVTIQIVGNDGKLLATVQARNDEKRHAEVVILERLEALPNKKRFAGATMIISGDQEVCSACTPAVRKFAETHDFKEAYGDTAHVPQITSGGKLTGKDATAKTTIGKMSDPAELDKVERAQRAASQIGPDQPVRRSFQRKILYRAPGPSAPAAQQASTQADAVKPALPPAAKPDAAAKPSPMLSSKVVPPPTKIAVPAQVAPAQLASSPASGGRVKSAAPQVKTAPAQPAVAATPVAPPAKLGAPTGADGSPAAGNGPGLSTGAGRGDLKMAAGAGAATVIGIIAVPVLNELLQELHAERFAEHARKRFAETLEKQRPSFEKFIRNHRREIEEAQADGRTVLLNVFLALNWQDGADTDPIAGSHLSAGRVLMSVEVLDIQLVHEGHKPKPYRKRGVGEQLGAAFRTSLGAMDSYERVDIEIVGTNAEAKRIREIDEALKKAAPESDEAKALTTEREKLDAVHAEFVKQRKASKAAEATREKAAKEKREKERLAQVVANDKFKAAQNQKSPALAQLMPPPAAVSFGGAAKGQAQGPLLGPLDVSGEAGPAERAELLAAAYEHKRVQWVGYAQEILRRYEAKTLTDEQRERFRARRDQWIADTRVVAKWMRDNKFGSAANRMDAIVQWIDGDGHNALLVGL